uniref:Uncharacterized protein n=1 Tax=Dichotomosiphon tuberosus TaxID=118263 RepID=A0A386AWT6_9CHLO|nr:hypothetical protein [Dichotomosiphon tuberosus]
MSNSFKSDEQRNIRTTSMSENPKSNIPQYHHSKRYPFAKTKNYPLFNLTLVIFFIDRNGMLKNSANVKSSVFQRPATPWFGQHNQNVRDYHLCLGSYNNNRNVSPSESESQLRNGKFQRKNTKVLPKHNDEVRDSTKVPRMHTSSNSSSTSSSSSNKEALLLFSTHILEFKYLQINMPQIY